MSNEKVTVTAFRGPEVVRVVEEPALPEAGPGEVRVRTEASCVTTSDTSTRNGLYPYLREEPSVALGHDLVEIVVGPARPTTRVTQARGSERGEKKDA